MDMKTLFRTWLGLFIVAAFGMTASASAAAPPERAPATTGANGYAHPNWLVSAAWLAQHLHDRNLKVVALTPAAEFAQGHIPGAAQVDWPALGLEDTSPSSVARWRTAMAQELTRLGITPRDTVVIYDGGTLFAARLWWVLEDLGHADQRILDGGLPAWVAAGGKMESGPATQRTAAEPYHGRFDSSDLATFTQVQAAIGKPGVVLLDARTGSEYAAGHIPGAVNVNYPENAVATSPHFWKPAVELRALYAGVGATPGKEIIPYCSSGTRSAVTYFTLRLLGYPRVRLYTGSWDEWAQHADAPVARGERP